MKSGSCCWPIWPNPAIDSSLPPEAGEAEAEEPEAPEAPAEEVTLTIESWRNDDLPIWQDVIIPAFNAHYPDIEVVFAPTAPAAMAFTTVLLAPEYKWKPSGVV